MDVRFYHLTTTAVDVALPQMLERTLARGHRAIVRVPDVAQGDALDQHLWTYAKAGFLPHAVAGGAHDAVQPILLSSAAVGSAGNAADYAFWVNGFDPAVASGGEATGSTQSAPWAVDAEADRLSILFLGAAATQLETARKLYRQALEADNINPSYWQQDAAGRWAQAG